ncbi:sigma 54-interacting transcriptional regulator [Brassicibacter mesophilus]|uniref:sigma 54-interacting transcriptional regulator n=1 Tax=Brassicibacter mesophilus TaxID=745119 RepID=UPI003D2379F0
MLPENLFLEKNLYINADETDYRKIMNIFYLAETTYLPVIQNRKVIGMLSLFCLVESFDKKESVLDIMDRDFVFINKNSDNLYIYNLNQTIVPIVNDKDIYVGFIRREILQNYYEIEDIKKAHLEQIQYYMDLEEEFEAIFESSKDGIHITDGNGVTLRFNSACERIDGVKADDIIGKHMSDLVECGVYSESVALEVLEKEKPVTILQKVNGKEIVATGTPIFKKGKMVRVVINSRDITELNKLKRDLNQSQLISKKYETELELLRWEHIKENNIIINSKKIKKIMDLAVRVAKVDSTVLIQGESGVGKGVLSKLIHRNSRRKGKPFIKIDCGSIPENLLESELFGYEKGSFTGANKDGKIGLIELANEGTLFLDEIGELSLNLQVKLLRVIQDREILRVGGKTTVPVDIRIIAATNRNLKDMVREKKFREDLYYRLNVVPIYIPPLRERKEDVQPIIMSCLERFNKKYGYAKKIKPEAMKYLIEYDWLGNVREVENIVERLVVTTVSEYIEVEDLISANIRSAHNKATIKKFNQISSFKDIMQDYEKELLLDVMKNCKSTQEMSYILKLDPSTIRKKFKKLNIDNPF